MAVREGNQINGAEREKREAEWGLWDFGTLGLWDFATFTIGVISHESYSRTVVNPTVVQSYSRTVAQSYSRTVAQSPTPLSQPRPGASV